MYVRKTSETSSRSFWTDSSNNPRDKYLGMAGKPDRRRELNYLLGCCAPKPMLVDPTDADFDWSWLEQAAHAQGVLPLVARQLATLEGPPPQIRERIRTHAAAIALR